MYFTVMYLDILSRFLHVRKHQIIMTALVLMQMFSLVVNIGIGLVLFQSPHCGSVDIQGTTGDYILVYYILYLAFIVTWEIVLYAFFTYLTMKAPYSSELASLVTIATVSYTSI